MLETRVVLSVLRHISLKNKRLFFLPDNQPSGAALAKGRSSSPRLNVILRKIAMIVLLKNLYMYQAWTGTTLQPADRFTRIKTDPRPGITHGG